MKRIATYGLLIVLTLSGCTKRQASKSLPAPKAYGTQILEVSGEKQIGGVGSKLSDPLEIGRAHV